MQIKDPIIFVVGAGIGAGIAWFLTKRAYEKRIQEEVNSVKETFAQLYEDAKKRADENKNKPDLDSYAEWKRQQEETQTAEEINSELQNKTVNTHATDYTDFINGLADNPREIDTSGLGPQPVEKNPDKSRPYLINRLPYSNEKPNYDVITVIYYADGTYAEPHGTEMEVEDYIGTNLMDYVENTDKDEIFIRNDDLEIDIDIVKDARSYDEIMFG